MKIDAHQHFWNFDPVRDAWITDDMKVIQKDFLPNDLEPALTDRGINGCIAVQADQSEEETLFLLDLADQYDFILGVVGWIDLRKENIQSRLGAFARYKKLKGFRHVVQSEPDNQFLLGENFCKGIALLGNYRFTYDILVKPHQLNATIKFVEKFPNQLFVIDHLAKPFIKDKVFGDWKKQMHELGQFENLSCKISGMVTEADWKNWKTLDFKPYIDHVIDSFGTDRVMFGSDWPVCLVAATYEQVCDVVEKNTAHLSQSEKRLLWGLNAKNFYDL
jgi:L-fuconolactonase